MAEAHSAVAFSFSVTPDGVDVKFNHEALKAVVYSGVRSYKKRIGFLKNYIYNHIFPSSVKMYSILISVVFATYLAGIDVSFGFIKWMSLLSQPQFNYPYGLYIELWIFATILWIVKWIVMKKSLKMLLSYHGWMYESRNKISKLTKIWMGLTSLFVPRTMMLNTFQSSLPTLPVPLLKETIHRFLKSIEPLTSQENYIRIELLANEFQNGIGKKLQQYVVLKSWWTTNYVSDWWEEYVYLRGRAPIMVNSNYYGVVRLISLTIMVVPLLAIHVLIWIAKIGIY